MSVVCVTSLSLTNLRMIMLTPRKKKTYLDILVRAHVKWLVTALRCALHFNVVLLRLHRVPGLLAGVGRSRKVPLFGQESRESASVVEIFKVRCLIKP